MEQRLIKISKFLSRVLRHRPEKINLILDENGWAEVSELIEKANSAGIRLSEEMLHQIVEQNDKKRYAFNEDETRIRANQGHSIPIDLALPVMIPPENLYHGTTIRFIPSIKIMGLLSKRRNHVHLSVQIQTAMRIGSRHGEPVVLRISAQQMMNNGYKFYYSENGIWLTEHVPVNFIHFE